jgi:endonuclease/exonuclease/phosphatase family metal-dependent hydrolase
MSKYYESYCFRIVSWAKFRDKATGREFICTNVHLDGETDEPFKILMDFVNKNVGIPMILAGDFNRKTGSPIMNSLNEYAPLKDASQGTEGSKNVDWVFVSRNTVDVLSYKLGLVDGIENPSDHKPRVAELLIC